MNFVDHLTPRKLHRSGSILSHIILTTIFYINGSVLHHDQQQPPRKTKKTFVRTRIFSAKNYITILEECPTIHSPESPALSAAKAIHAIFHHVRTRIFSAKNYFLLQSRHLFYAVLGENEDCIPLL